MNNTDSNINALQFNMGLLKKYCFSVLAIIFILFISDKDIVAKCPKVHDAENAIPVARVSIFDRTGKMIATGDNNGNIPNLSPDSYPITLRCLGYSDKTVYSRSDSIIEMSRLAFELPELKVDSKKRPILHLTGYLREVSSMSSSVDTVMLYREKWVDFMIPVGNGKHFKGWTDPRILKSKSYYKFTDAWGRDSVADRTNHHFSWSDWLSLPPRVNQLTSVIKNLQVTDTLMGTYSPAEIWKRDGERIRVDVDVLADTLRSKWTPRLNNRLWRDLDFERLLLTFEYSDCDTFSVNPQNIDRLSCYIETIGRGHDMFRFKTLYDNSLYVTTYVDLIIADREYLTVKEAKRREKDQLLALEESALVLESEKMPRDSVINDLIARVNAINHDSRRLGMDLDTRVGNGRLPLPPVYTKKDKFLRALKTVLSSMGTRFN